MLQAELLNSQTLPYAQKEVLHYKKSLLLGLELIDSNGSFNIDDLINVHCGILPDKAGFRNRPGVHIGNRLGEIIYTPPQEEQEILEYIENLFSFH